MIVDQLIKSIDSLISQIDGISKKAFTKEGAKKSTKLIDEYALADQGISILFEKVYLEEVVNLDTSVLNLNSVSIGDLEGGNAIQVLSLARALFLIGVKNIKITIYSSLLSLKNKEANVIKKVIGEFNGGEFLSINITKQSVLINNFNSYDIIIFDEFKGNVSSPIKPEKILEIKNRLLIDQTVMAMNNPIFNDFYINYETVINENLDNVLCKTKISRNKLTQTLLESCYHTLGFSGDEINVEYFDVKPDNILLEKTLDIFITNGKTTVKKIEFKTEFKKILLDQLNTVCKEETPLVFRENIAFGLVQLSNNVSSSFTPLEKYIINSIFSIHRENVLKKFTDADSKKVYEFIKEMNSVDGYLNEDNLKNLNIKTIKALFDSPELDSTTILQLIKLIEYKFYQLDFFKKSIAGSTGNTPSFIIQVGKKVFEDFSAIGLKSLDIINGNPIKKVADQHEDFINILKLNFKQKIISGLLDTKLKSDLETVELSSDSLVSNKDIKIATVSQKGTSKKVYFMYYEREKATIKADTVRLEESILNSIQNKAKHISIENIQSWYKACYKHLGYGEIV